MAAPNVVNNASGNNSAATIAEKRQRWKNQVKLGDLSPDFLRVGFNPAEQQVMTDAQHAQYLMAQQQAGFGPVIPANVIGRLSITIAQAKLSKNYGLTKMDPYCRIRLGHSILETPTAHNGAKNPRWNKVIQCYLPQGVDSFYVEIYDEKTFSMDDRIAWSHIPIPEIVLTGETVDDWYTLSGRQGDDKEGMINLVLSFSKTTQPTAIFPQQVMMVPAQPIYYPMTVGGAPVYNAGMVAPGIPAQYPPQQQPAIPIQQGPLYTEEDLKQVKDMFPNIEEDVVVSVLEANNGNKNATINALLGMVD
ncbi:toll-interacting protein-like [Tubulanus polymorphus]|uniref:toll-interacting protein-like n=1 Tax=Tubulanus polymorphus TaxID=672921 RepID=UPI003DA2C832